MANSEFLQLFHPKGLRELRLVSNTNSFQQIDVLSADEKRHRWLGADPTAMNSSHCTPSSSHYDWYEYAHGACIVNGPCKFHTINYLTASPSEPAFEEDYVVMSMQVAEGERGLMFLSYFDRDQGATAIGVRKVLHGDDKDEGRECREA